MRIISGKYWGIDISKCEFIGKGREGKVYLTSQGYALKIFKNKRRCIDEYKFLKKILNNIYFPKVFKRKGKCILREYVSGISLEEYIKKNGLTKDVAYKLVYLIEEFKKLGFTRLDIASRHIYIQNDNDIKVIDLRKSYTKKVHFPKILLSELEKLGVLEKFIKIVFEINSKIAVEWVNNINNYNKVIFSHN